MVAYCCPTIVHIKGGLIHVCDQESIFRFLNLPVLPSDTNSIYRSASYLVIQADGPEVRGISNCYWRMVLYVLAIEDMRSTQGIIFIIYSTVQYTTS
jgi:hypothetical protein